jgi:hypothetical protein
MHSKKSSSHKWERETVQIRPVLGGNYTQRQKCLHLSPEDRVSHLAERRLQAAADRIQF